MAGRGSVRNGLTPKGRFFNLTIFYEEAAKEHAVNMVTDAVGRDGCVYTTYGEEVCPDTGRKHLQVYMEFAQPRRCGGVKLLFRPFRPHVSVVGQGARGKNLARQRWSGAMYAMKGSAKEGFPNGPGPDWVGVETGVRPAQPVVKATMLERCSDAVSKCRSGEWDSIPADIRLMRGNALLLDRSEFYSNRCMDDLPVLQNLWIVGPTRVGKSFFVNSTFVRTDVYKKPLSRWWSGYQFQPVVWIDELESKSQIGASDMKTIADVYPFLAEPKREYWRIRPRHIIVTSNYRLEDVYKDHRQYLPLRERFQVVDLYGGRCLKGAYGDHVPVCFQAACPCLLCEPDMEAKRARVARELQFVVRDWELNIHRPRADELNASQLSISRPNSPVDE